MSGPGQGVDEVATSGTMWYASRMKNGSRSQPARHTRSIPLVMISLTQEILMALERSSRCCEETLPLFFTWRRQYSRLLFSNFLVGSLAPNSSSLSFHTHYKSGVIDVVEYELRSVAFLVSTIVQYSSILGPKLASSDGFVTRK